MVFTVGPEPQVFKDKTGQLTVVRAQLSTGRNLEASSFGSPAAESPPNAGSHHPVSPA